MNEKSMYVSSRSNTTYLVQLTLLVAIILIMAFTPIGYIKTFGLEITLIVVPVAVGSVILGSKGGAVLGTAFGLTSFIQCFGLSPFGAVLLGINPLGAFITCVIPRFLTGWLSGLLFDGLQKTGRPGLKKISILAANLCCPLLNTALFMSSLVIFFYHTDYIQEFVHTLGAANPFTFVLLFVGINGLVEAAACFLAGSAVSKALIGFKRR